MLGEPVIAQIVRKISPQNTLWRALSRYRSAVAWNWWGSYAHAAAVTICHTLIASLRNRR